MKVSASGSGSAALNLERENFRKQERERERERINSALWSALITNNKDKSKEDHKVSIKNTSLDP